MIPAKLLLANQYWEHGMPVVDKGLAVVAAGQIMRMAGEGLLGQSAAPTHPQFFVVENEGIKVLNNLLLLKNKIERLPRK